MDVIVSGKISREEPMADVIETLMTLKKYPHLVLRVTSSDSELEGRICFYRGSHILGGRINNSSEAGYSAVLQLLSVTEGNYAILDPGDESIGDINQVLWIVSERVKNSLPDLPKSPMDLLDASKELQEVYTESRIFYPATMPSADSNASQQADVRSNSLHHPDNLKDLTGNNRRTNITLRYLAQLAIAIAIGSAIGTALAIAVVKYRIFSTSVAPAYPHSSASHSQSLHPFSLHPLPSHR